MVNDMSQDDHDADDHPDDEAVGVALRDAPSDRLATLDGTGHGLRQVGQVISDDTSPSFTAVRFRVNPGCFTGPGRFVAIETRDDRGEDLLVLARVQNVHEVNPHEDAQSSTLRDVLSNFGTTYATEGASTVIFRIADAEPLQEATLDATGRVESVRAITSMPLSSARVFEAGPDLTVQALGLEPDPDDGLDMGHVQGAPDVPVSLAKTVVQRHIFIGGGIGSGKSYTRGVIAEELCGWGVPQVNIDVNGEMRDATTELGGMNVVPGAGFTLPLSALSPSDVLDAVPAISKGTNMETLLRFTHESLLADVARGKLTHFGVDQLVDHIEDCAWRLEMTSGSGDAKKLEKRTVEPTKLRTGSLRRLSFLGTPFDWRAALQPGAVINIDCTGMSIGELRLVAASVARDLQQLARQRAIPFTVLSIDEFHLVAPSDDAAIATQVLREIARVGRHYRLGLILTTQSPSDVDRSILKRLLTRFLHAIEPDQLDALKGVFSDASPDLVRTLPKLPQGTCILTGAYETVRHATVVKIRPRRTTHGGQTPDVFGDLAAAGWTSKRIPGQEPT